MVNDRTSFNTERALCMREVPGSKPGSSIAFCSNTLFLNVDVPTSIPRYLVLFLVFHGCMYTAASCPRIKLLDSSAKLTCTCTCLYLLALGWIGDGLGWVQHVQEAVMAERHILGNRSRNHAISAQISTGGKHLDVVWSRSSG